MKNLKIAVVALISIAVGIGTSYSAGCIYTFDEDSCLDVQCPSGCYNTGSFGPKKSKCQIQGNNCCNCWYRERYCNTNGTSSPCTISTGSPNGKAWETLREQVAGPCHTESNVDGTICLYANHDPF